MAKYFSSVKTKTNNYNFSDIALLIADLDGADQIFGTAPYKTMIRKSAILFGDTSKPCYLDLSDFRDKANNRWLKKMTAKEFLDEMNKDMERFVDERHSQPATPER